MLPLLLPHAICIALDAAHTPACNGKLTAIPLTSYPALATMLPWLALVHLRRCRLSAATQHAA